MGELGEFVERDFGDVLRSELRLTASTVPGCALASAAGLQHKGDDVHFDTPSLRELGSRYADAWASLALAESWRYQAPAALPATMPRKLAFSPADATPAWQESVRAELWRLLCGGGRPASPADPNLRVLREEVPAGASYTLQEIEFDVGPDGPDRAATGWLALPLSSSGPVAGVLALPGHGGTAEEVMTGQSARLRLPACPLPPRRADTSNGIADIYPYGQELAEQGVRQ